MALRLNAFNIPVTLRWSLHASLWFGLGLFSFGLDGFAQGITSSEKTTAVVTATRAATMPDSPPQSSTAEARIRVVVRSFEMAVIGAELNARITRLPAREGDRFRKGDVLVQFDCARIAAELEAATASYNAHKAAFDNQAQLRRYKAAGSLAVDQARFEMKKSEAEVRGLEAKQTACTIVAPFDGRMIEKSAQIHEIAQPNQPLIKIANEDRLELVLMVPSAWLAKLKDGTIFQIVVDETNERHAARIVQSTGLIDPISQSVRFIAEIVTPSQTILPGMSGTAEFSNLGVVR